jgi:WD40 repeat protein
MSSNPKRPHSSRQTLLLCAGLAAPGLFAFIGCTQNLMVGSSTMSDLHPGQPDAGSTGGTTASGSCTPGCIGLACSGTGGTPGVGTGGAGVAGAHCTTISTAPGTLNACGLTFGIAYSPDGQLIATATETGSPNIHVWRLSDGALMEELYGHGGGSYGVAFSPDGTILASSGIAPSPVGCVVSGLPTSPDMVKLWDVSTGALLHDLPATSGNYADTAQFSPDGARLVTAGMVGPIQIWNVADGAPLTSIATSYTTYNARFSPDGTRVVTAGESSNGGVWNASNGSPLFSLAEFGEDMNDAAYSPDGTEIVATGPGGTLRFFDPNGNLLQSFVAHTVNYISHVVWVDEDNVVSDDWGGNVKSWTRDATGQFAASGGWSIGGQALGLAVSPDKKTIAVAGGSGAEGFMFLSYQPVAPAAIQRK